MVSQQKLVTEKLTQQELEQTLWKAADILRGAVRPERYGTYMFPLLFFKRLSDVWTEEYEQALKKYKNKEAAQQKFVHRFIIPEGCFWTDIRKETQKLVKRRLSVYGKKYRFQINGFHIRDMKKWAQCTKDGTLSFNWQLMGLPRELADYVILHELSHLKEFNHSRRFKYELASVCPDFREEETKLRRFVISWEDV